MAQQPSGKKPYRTPRLVEYGSIAKLTQTGAEPVADKGGKQACL
jgi:hypothetical protein